MTGPMRVTQVMLTRTFGGAERYFVDLCLELSERGFEVQAICHRRFHGRQWLEARQGLQVDAIPVLGTWDRLAAGRMGTLIRDFDPSVVHAHLARAACLGGAAARRAGVPVCVKTHNYVALKYYRDVDAFITTTQDQREYLLSQGVADDEVRVVPNFSRVSADDVTPPLSDPGSPPTFGALGRFVPEKGFHLLVKAFARAFPAPSGARLAIAGDGPERQRLAALVEAEGLSGQVTLPGWTNDVTGFLDGIDVFVLPSTFEPFGIVLIEAMARGRVIVSTEVAGPLEFLDDSTALLIPPDSVDALRQALVTIAADPERARARAAEARHRFRDSYSAEAVVPRIVEIYRTLAGQAGNTRPLSTSVSDSR